MGIAYTREKSPDYNELKKQFDTSKIICKFPYADREAEKYIHEVLHFVLKQISKEHFLEMIDYCIKELVMNASKANSKRVFFEDEGLDITDPEHYEKGISQFKEKVYSNFDKYAELHVKNQTYVRVDFKYDSQGLVIYVINNTGLLAGEEARIRERFENSRKIQDISDAIEHEFDQTEGGGFGLILAILMLREKGLGCNALSYRHEKVHTAFRLVIPQEIEHPEHTVVLSQEITAALEKMPQFPKSLGALQEELSRPGCSFQSIADKIMRDSALTTEILRIANSAIYRFPKKVHDVFTAVKMIGLEGVKNLLYSYGVQTIMSSVYSPESLKSISNHSTRVAYIISAIIRMRNLTELSDSAPTAALVHDFGKIIVHNISPELESRLQTICENKGIPMNVLETLTGGYDHSLLGSMLAGKWNFPPELVEAIRYHHAPWECQDEFRSLTNLLYTANELYYVIDGDNDYFDIDKDLLKTYGIFDVTSFDSFVKKIQNEITDL